MFCRRNTHIHKRKKRENQNLARHVVIIAYVEGTKQSLWPNGVVDAMVFLHHNPVFVCNPIQLFWSSFSSRVQSEGLPNWRIISQRWFQRGESLRDVMLSSSPERKICGDIRVCAALSSHCGVPVKINEARKSMNIFSGLSPSASPSGFRQLCWPPGQPLRLWIKRKLTDWFIDWLSDRSFEWVSERVIG